MVRVYEKITVVESNEKNCKSVTCIYLTLKVCRNISKNKKWNNTKPVTVRKYKTSIFVLLRILNTEYQRELSLVKETVKIQNKPSKYRVGHSIPRE